MSTDPVKSNLELVLDWIDALRRSDVDSLAERFHPDVVWEDVGGSVACQGREQVLAWLRASPSCPHEVDALELVADRDSVLLGIRAFRAGNSAALAGRPHAALTVANPRRASAA